MPKLFGRFLALSILCAAGAFGQQGTFGDIAYGGSWQTTFTLMNLKLCKSGPSHPLFLRG